MSHPLIGHPIHEVDTPALLLDADAVQANIDRMAAFFADKLSNVRPHFKSHKCTHIARLQMEAGAVGITCAKLGEAEKLVDAGIRDVFIANQIIGAPKMARLVEVARRSEVMVAVDSLQNVQELSRAMQAAGTTLRVLVEVDIGMKRCGVAPGEPALSLARLVVEAPGLQFTGLQGYEGHTVLLRDAEEQRRETLRALETLVAARRYIEDAGLTVHIATGGGTGTYQITGAFLGMDEVQAGSYAAMDWYYGDIRPEFRQAMSILVTIISRPRLGIAILDVGTKGVGTEFGPPRIKDHKEGNIPSLKSEEHTTAELPEASGSIGDKVELIPSHGCTTSNLYRQFVVHRDGRVIDVWPIEGFGCLT